MNRIRVLLVDDHPVVCEGLQAMLATAPDIEVVARAGDGFEAVEKAREHQPHVILMDLRLPNLDGLEATRRIKRQRKSAAIIVLTAFGSESYVVDAVKAGASGYLLKDTSRDLLLHAIRAANSGGMLIKPNLLRGTMNPTDITSNQISEAREDTAALGELTCREREVLRLVTDGYSNKQIGRALTISEETVKKHVQTIISKLGVSDRTQAAVKAVRAGLFQRF